MCPHLKILFVSSEKEEDAYTSDEEKHLKKNTRQRTYHQKNLTNFNSNKHASYYKKKLAAQEQKREELNTEKEASFWDEKKQMNWVWPIPLIGT